MDIHQELFEIHTYIQTGWNQYSMYFYISGVAAIIGSFFKLAGIGAFILTLTFFYFMGKAHTTIAKQHNLEQNKAKDQLAASQQASGSP